MRRVAFDRLRFRGSAEERKRKLGALRRPSGPRLGATKQESDSAISRGSAFHGSISTAKSVNRCNCPRALDVDNAGMISKTKIIPSFGVAPTVAGRRFSKAEFIADRLGVYPQMVFGCAHVGKIAPYENNVRVVLFCNAEVRALIEPSRVQSR
jgi:hypothetical protein